MLSIKNERRHRKAVELICEKLQITDTELNAFIAKDKVQEVKSPELKSEKKSEKKKGFFDRK